jgi:surface polysaccharide O-acyltransferase-like enzyme
MMLVPITWIVIVYVVVCGISVWTRTNFGWTPWRFYLQGLLCIAVAYVLLAILITTSNTGIDPSDIATTVGTIAEPLFAVGLIAFSLDRMLKAHKSII